MLGGPEASSLLAQIATEHAPLRQRALVMLDGLAQVGSRIAAYGGARAPTERILTIWSRWGQALDGGFPLPLLRALDAMRSDDEFAAEVFESALAAVEDKVEHALQRHSYLQSLETRDFAVESAAIRAKAR